LFSWGYDLELSLVIPFYNEEKSVTEVVDNLVESLDSSSIDYELILVNNGSKDKSPDMLSDLESQKPDRIKVVHVGVNQGFGWGIINGLRQASGEFIGYMSGDGQLKPADIIKTYYYIKDGDFDLVKVKRVTRNDGIIRKFLSIGYNFLSLVVFNVRTLDVNGHPKILKKELMEVITPTSKDWFIDAEIMIKAKYLNVKLGEVSVEFLRREKGRSHVAFTTILEFLKNMANYKFGKGIREWKQKVK